MQRQAEAAEVQDQHWQLDVTESSQYVRRGILCDIDNIDFANMVPMHQGLMDFVCTYCGAIGFRKENHGTLSSIHFGIVCCNSGKTHITIDPQVELPDYFQTLFTSDQPIYKYFRKNIQRFNAGLCMVSMHAKDETANRYQGGVACYRISGQVFRTIGNIWNNDGAPHFLQTYFYDNEDQATIRAGF